MIHLQLSALSGYSVQRKTFEGRPHVVVPVVLLVEGVHAGSNGPTLYPEEELKSYPASWNGIPVPVLHPTDDGGDPISCNSPEIIEQTTIGRLFNVQYNHPKLSGEVWVDELKAQKIAPQVLKDLLSCKMIEVSTGLFSDKEDVEGEWNGEHYNAIVRNIRPDHLALLPGQTGACSVADGCGIRANKKGGDNVKLLGGFGKEYVENIFANKKSDKSFENTRQMIQKKIDEEDTPPKWDDEGELVGDYVMNYVIETFSDSFVYMKESKSGSKLCKRNYSIANDGSIELDSEVVEVREETKYVPVANANSGEINTNKKEEVSMTNVKKCCPQKVKELIDNTASPFTAEDKEWLENLSEEQFGKISTVNTQEKEPEPEVKPTEAEVQANAKKQADVEAGLALLAEKKSGLVATIVANKKNTFTADELNSKEIVELEKIAALTKVEDFSAQGSADITDNSGKTEVLDLPTMNFEKK